MNEVLPQQKREGCGEERREKTDDRMLSTQRYIKRAR